MYPSVEGWFRVQQNTGIIIEIIKEREKSNIKRKRLKKIKKKNEYGKKNLKKNNNKKVPAVPKMLKVS